MVPPFATAHTFCAFQEDTRNYDFIRTVATNTTVFFARFFRKEDRSNGF